MVGHLPYKSQYDLDRLRRLNVYLGMVGPLPYITQFDLARLRRWVKMGIIIPSMDIDF
jgi:hypothetical protein